MDLKTYKFTILYKSADNNEREYKVIAVSKNDALASFKMRYPEEEVISVYV